MEKLVILIYIAGIICSVLFFFDIFRYRIENVLILLFAYFIAVLIGLFFSPIMIIVYFVNKFH